MLLQHWKRSLVAGLLLVAVSSPAYACHKDGEPALPQVSIAKASATAATTPLPNKWTPTIKPLILVYVDRTDKSWPVKAGIAEWNKVLGANRLRQTINLRYETSCPIVLHAPCIEIKQVNDLPGADKNGYIGGQTYYGINVFGYITSSRIALNNKVPSKLRDEVIRHEIGHTIGLKHVTDKNALMYPWTRDGAQQIGVPDVNAIKKAYS
jgi:hypothetical protein